jgi:radical SAM superfamily enzyme YgiQ (UPF0313 family)
LHEAGFARKRIGVYLLAGMPGQSLDDVRRAVQWVKDCGAVPKINEYSPIPGTGEWEGALALSGVEIAEEPLWQNNSLYYTRPEHALTREGMDELRRWSLE